MDKQFEELCDEFSGAWIELGESLRGRFHISASVQVPTKVDGRPDTHVLTYKRGEFTLTSERDGSAEPLQNVSLDLRIWVIRYVPDLVRKLELLEQARLHDVAGATDALRGITAGLKAG